MTDDLLGIGKALEAFEKLTKEMRELAQAYWQPQLEEKGKLLADRIRLKRLENTVRVMEKTQDLLQDKRHTPEALPLNLRIPLLESASLEEDETLQSKWAGLLASSLAGDPVLISYPKILSELTPLEARLLDVLFEANAHRTVGADPSVFATSKSSAVMTVLSLDGHRFLILAENLSRLGLLESVTANPLFWKDMDYMRSPSFEEIRLTAIGYEFVKACKGPIQ